MIIGDQKEASKLRHVQLFGQKGPGVPAPLVLLSCTSTIKEAVRYENERKKQRLCHGNVL